MLLVVEVADSALAYDRDAKLPLYAGFGIREAWLVDVAGRSITVHRDPTAGGYASAVVADISSPIALVALDGAFVDLSGLFP